MYKINYQKLKKFLSQSDITFEDHEDKYTYNPKTFENYLLNGQKEYEKINPLEKEIYQIAIDLLFNQPKQSELIYLNLSPEAKNIFSNKIQMAQFVAFDFIHNNKKSNLISHIDVNEFSEIIFDTNKDNVVFQTQLLAKSTPYDGVFYNYSLTNSIDLNFINTSSTQAFVEPQTLDYNNKGKVLSYIKNYPEKIHTILDNIRPKLWEDPDFIRQTLEHSASHLVEAFEANKSPGLLFSYTTDDDEQKKYPFLSDAAIELASEDSYLMRSFISAMKNKDRKNISSQSVALNIMREAIQKGFQSKQERKEKILKLTLADFAAIKKNQELNLNKSYEKIISTLQKNYLNSIENISSLVGGIGEERIQDLQNIQPFIPRAVRESIEYIQLLEKEIRVINKKSDTLSDFISETYGFIMSLQDKDKEFLETLFVECPNLGFYIAKASTYTSKKLSPQVLDVLSDPKIIDNIVNFIPEHVKNLDSQSQEFKETEDFKITYLYQISQTLDMHKKTLDISKEHLKYFLSTGENGSINPDVSRLFETYIYKKHMGRIYDNELNSDVVEVVDQILEFKHYKLFYYVPTPYLLKINDKDHIKEIVKFIRSESLLEPEFKIKLPQTWLENEEIMYAILPQKDISSFFQMKKEYISIYFADFEKSIKTISINPSLIKFTPNKIRESLRFQDEAIKYMREDFYSRNKYYFNKNIWNRVEFCKSAIQNKKSSTNLLKYIPDHMFSNYDFLIHVADLVDRDELKSGIFRFNEKLLKEINEKKSPDGDYKTFINTLRQQQRLSAGLQQARMNNPDEETNTVVMRKKI